MDCETFITRAHGPFHIGRRQGVFATAHLLKHLGAPFIHAHRRTSYPLRALSCHRKMVNGISVYSDPVRRPPGSTMPTTVCTGANVRELGAAEKLKQNGIHAHRSSFINPSASPYCRNCVRRTALITGAIDLLHNRLQRIVCRLRGAIIQHCCEPRQDTYPQAKPLATDHHLLVTNNLREACAMEGSNKVCIV